MKKETKKRLIKLLAVIIVAVLIMAELLLAVWLICFGFGIEFKVRYVFPVYAFIILNKSFPINLYHHFKKIDD